MSKVKYTTIGIVAIVALACVIWVLMPMSMKKSIKTTQSSVIGLDRTISVYTEDGKLIKQWEGRAKVFFNPETMGVPEILIGGKDIKVIGGILIIEEK